MTTKSVFIALAVVMLTGTMAVATLADDREMNLYGPAEPSISSPPGQEAESPDSGEIREPVETGTAEPSMSSPPEQEAELPDTGEIREPAATGALPDRPESSSELTCCPDSGDPTFWHGGP